MTTFSAADVATERPERFAKQLVSHLGRRNGGEWSEQAREGWIQLGSGRVELTCGPGVLHLHIEASAEAIPEVEDVVGRHLLRFDSRDELDVLWRRADGTETRQLRPE